MTAVKPSSSEEEYFARLDVEKKKKLTEEIKSKYKQDEQLRLKEMHFMHCSKCGMELHSLVFRGMVIEKCYGCGAVVFDQDEFEKLAGSTGESLIKSVLGLFK